MDKIGAFVAWSAAVLVVSGIGTILIVRANNRAMAGSNTAKLLGKG